MWQVGMWNYLLTAATPSYSLPSQYNIIRQDSWTPYHDSEIVQRLSGGALVLRHLGDFEQFYLILRIPG